VLRCIRPTGEEIQLGIGLRMVEMRSVGVLHCVSRVQSYCFLCLYWCQFLLTDGSLVYC